MSFSFGSATPGFGGQPQQPSTNFAFGGALAQAPTFGTPASAPSTGFSFGSPATSTASNLFGTPNANVPAPSFGAPATSSAPNLFGTPNANVSAPSFGTPNTTAAAASGFGGGFGFGGATTSAPSALGAGLSFGAAPAAASTAKQPALSFGTPAATASFSFASTTTPAATSSLSFGAPAAGGLSFGATTTIPSLGLGFGSSSTGTTAPTLNFGTTTTASTGLSFGLGTSTPSTGLSFGFGASQAPMTAATTTQAAPSGLGGVASSTPSQSAEASKPEQAPKEQNLPNEIQQTVENFKAFVKQQKGFSSDVARCSIKEFKRVEGDIDAENNLLNEVEKELQMNKCIAEKLKYETACVLQQVEIAQRTFDTPLGLQYDNVTPLKFFIDLTDNFERDIQCLKQQIENTDKYLKNIGKAAPLTSQDLTKGMRRIHETFIALAGRLQSVHSQVESEKEQYLSFRKNMLNDSTNVFETTTDVSQTPSIDVALNLISLQPPKIPFGPTPFNAANPSVVQAAAQNMQTPIAVTTNTFGSQPSTSFNWGGPSNSTLTGGSLFGQSGFGATPSNSFQLQKPPTGNKRAK